MACTTMLNSILNQKRANRMGIATPKKETANKTWSDADLESALGALRRREISANKAAKIYKIPSSVCSLKSLPKS